MSIRGPVEGLGDFICFGIFIAIHNIAMVVKCLSGRRYDILEGQDPAGVIIFSLEELGEGLLKVRCGRWGRG